jgi:hypothetical protein
LRDLEDPSPYIRAHHKDEVIDDDEFMESDWSEEDDSDTDWSETYDQSDNIETEALAINVRAPHLSSIYAQPPDSLLQPPCSPLSPYAHLSELRDFMTSPTSLPDLTLALDLSSFPEWPVARGGFGDVWKGDIVDQSSEATGTLSKKCGLGAGRRTVAVKRLTMYTDAGEDGAAKIIKVGSSLFVLPLLSPHTVSAP